MHTLTININNKAYQHLIYFLSHLKSDVEIIEDYHEPSKQEILAHIKQALLEVKQIKSGKQQLQGTLTDLVNSLDDEH